MAKFHVNPSSGTVHPCSAQAGNCPYGDDDSHYETIGEARKAYESEMRGSIFENRNRTDEYSLKLSTAAERLANRPASPGEKIIYEEMMKAYAGGRVQAIHRAANIFAAKAQNAFEFGEDLDAQAYYNAYMLYDAAAEARIASAPYLRGLAAGDGDEVKNKLELEKINEKFDEKLARVVAGEAKFDIWMLSEAEESKNLSYKLKEVPLTHPRIHEVLSMADDVYFGKVSPQEKSEALQQIQTNGEKLLGVLQETYGSTIPDGWGSKLGPLDASGEYELIGSGSEVNVYLHEETKMVYKVRHKNGLLDHFSASEEAQKDYGKLAVVRLKESYENLQLSHLSELNASYIQTYFVEAKTEGHETAFIVQPYLDPREYGPYDPTAEERKVLSHMGLNDSHAGNMSIHLETGKIVLFDCIHVADNY